MQSNLRTRSCVGKRRHTSQEAAERHAIELVNNFRGISVQSYLCPFCGGWHVGRPPRSEKVKREIALQWESVHAARRRLAEI